MDTIVLQGQHSRRVVGGSAAGGLTLLDDGAHDTIQAGSGATTVTLDGSFGRTRGGTGNFTVDDPTANNTVIGGTADTTAVTVGAAAASTDVYGRAANTYILDLGNSAVIGAGGGKGVVTIGGANTELFGASPGRHPQCQHRRGQCAGVRPGANTTVDASSSAASGALVFGGFSSIPADMARCRS